MTCMPASAQSASRLNCAAESGINRIVAMRAPPGLVILPGSQAGARPFLLHKSHLEKNNAAAAAGCGEAHGVGGRKASSAVNFHRIGRLIRELLPFTGVCRPRLPWTLTIEASEIRFVSLAEEPMRADLGPERVGSQTRLSCPRVRGCRTLRRRGADFLGISATATAGSSSDPPF